MQGKRVLIASDHAGFQMKEYLQKLLEKLGCIVIDLGPADETPIDYPDKAYLGLFMNKNQNKQEKNGKNNNEVEKR